MKTGKWFKHHKWFGIALSVFLMMFVLSGIILNHRAQFADFEISRKYLPSRYEYSKWNGGLMRGSLSVSSDSVLIYGANGVWLLDKSTGAIEDFNRGLPAVADSLNVRRIVKNAAGRTVAATTTGAYVLKNGKWTELLKAEDKISDVESRGDSVIILTRSHVYLDAGDGLFKKAELKEPSGGRGKVSLFRTVWCLHSGELFGLPGRIFIDLIGVTLLFLCLSGILVWIGRPRGIKRWNAVWHNRVGRYTIVVTLLIVITGWCLRPPIMVPLALTKTNPVPWTALDSDNAWHDKLRAIRYDSVFNDWIISTSDGFYATDDLAASPRLLTATPPVSVMGINAWEKDEDGKWLCGSFSGMYRWDRKNGVSMDYFSGEKVKEVQGPPFGKNAVAGYSSDIADKSVVVDYYEGTDVVEQPARLNCLPMSLWNVALEVHSGRMYMGAIATYVFIFFIGAAIFWCLLSGYKIGSKHKHKD